jgi:hypothetical protein
MNTTTLNVICKRNVFGSLQTPGKECFSMGYRGLARVLSGGLDTLERRRESDLHVEQASGPMEKTMGAATRTRKRKLITHRLARPTAVNADIVAPIVCDKTRILASPYHPNVVDVFVVVVVVFVVVVVILLFCRCCCIVVAVHV